MKPAIELHGLTKDFATGLRGVKLRALDHLSLQVEAGQIYGLLGPNGSGKSTAIKLILGLLKPTLGSCSIFGVPGGKVEARQNVGYLPESPCFYRYLTGRELVRFYGRMGGLHGAALTERAGEIIDWVGLARDADRRVDCYSKGMLQRIGLAQALVHRPQLVILDEPTAGVDPAGTAGITAMIRKLKAEGRTVLITSHFLAQIEEVCDRVALLDRGRLVLEGAVSDLTGRADRQLLVVDRLGPGELEELQAWLAARGRTIESVTQPRIRLDQIFLERTGRPGREEGGS